MKKMPRQSVPSVSIVPKGTKIADITHADTNEHSKTASDFGLPSNTVAIAIFCIRIGGSGVFQVRSISAGSNMDIQTSNVGVWFRAVDGNFYYRLNTSGDDWDIYAIGYFVEHGTVV